MIISRKKWISGRVRVIVYKGSRMRGRVLVTMPDRLRTTNGGKSPRIVMFTLPPLCLRGKGRILWIDPEPDGKRTKILKVLGVRTPTVTDSSWTSQLIRFTQFEHVTLRRVAPGLILGPEKSLICWGSSWFFSVPAVECWDISLKRTTTVFLLHHSAHHNPRRKALFTPS
jgi:hypothetical protein